MRYLMSLMSSGETVQMVVRQHWVVIARSVVLNSLAFVVLVAAAIWGAGRDGSAARALAVAAALVAIVPAGLCLRDVWEWYATQFAVTTRRVIKISGVLNKQVSDSNLDKVNDIMLRQSMVGRALGYGDLEIVTGSDVGVDRLPRIRQPLQFQKVLLDNKEDFDTLVRAGDGAAMSPADIPVAIERLAELRKNGVISDEDFQRKKADLLARM